LFPEQNIASQEGGKNKLEKSKTDESLFIFAEIPEFHF
jgi:hypothetical protein